MLHGSKYAELIQSPKTIVPPVFCGLWLSLPPYCMCAYVCLCACVCVCVVQKDMSGGSLKRSLSTIADQRVNGLWQDEEKSSPERLYRPRHKSYKAAGQLSPDSPKRSPDTSHNRTRDAAGFFYLYLTSWNDI